MEKRDYAGLFLKIAIIFLAIMFICMLVAGSLDIPTDTTAHSIFRFFILGSLYALYFLLPCFVLFVIYNQFKDKNTILGIITFISFIVYADSYITSYYSLTDTRVSDMGIFALVIVIISCFGYYFFNIKPKFKAK